MFSYMFVVLEERQSEAIKGDDNSACICAEVSSLIGFTFLSIDTVPFPQCRSVHQFIRLPQCRGSSASLPLVVL